MTETNIQVDLIGQERLDEMVAAEKVQLILKSVKEDNVVVLEDGLTADEEGRLVEMAMQQISPDRDFSGIEIKRHNKPKQDTGGLLSKLTNRGSSEESSLTLIGPADRLQTVEEQGVMQAIIEK